jgi:hypothetical protein
MRSLGNTWSRVMGSASVVVALGILAASPAAAQARPKAKAKGLDIMLMQPTAVKAGANDFEVMVKGADEKPLSGADVSVRFVMPKTATMAEMRNEVKLTPSGAGMYMGSGNVMMAGTWNVTVSVKQSGKEVGHKTLALTAK